MGSVTMSVAISWSKKVQLACHHIAKWSGHILWSGGTIYDNINGPPGPLMYRQKGPDKT